MKIETKIDNLKNHKLLVKLMRSIDNFLQEEEFLKIDVPLLSPALIPESYLEFFETKNVYYEEKQRLYLIPSPELFLKRLMVQGAGNCYYLGKSFRNNEPIEIKHSYEFTMLEFYRVNGDYFNIVDDVMNLLRFLAKEIYGKAEIDYQGKKVNFEKFEKITVAEAFNKYAGITDIFDHKSFFEQAKNKGYRIDGLDYTDVWSQVYGIEVEPNLGKNGMPTIIFEYPRELAATAQFNKEKNVAERLEFYIEGIELGNCGNAATDKTNMEEHKMRFENDIKIRKKLGMVDCNPDFDFIDVLHNLPRCAGIAIGVDRLAMIFANLKSIQDLRVIQFE